MNPKKLSKPLHPEAERALLRKKNSEIGMENAIKKIGPGLFEVYDRELLFAEIREQGSESLSVNTTDTILEQVHDALRSRDWDFLIILGHTLKTSNKPWSIEAHARSKKQGEIILAFLREWDEVRDLTAAEKLEWITERFKDRYLEDENFITLDALNKLLGRDYKLRKEKPTKAKQRRKK